MAGLLDVFRDPESSTALGLLAAYGMAGRAPQGLFTAHRYLAEADERALKKKESDLRVRKGLLEIEDLERKGLLNRQIEQAAQQSFITPEKANSLSMGPMPDGGAPPMVQPGFNQRAFLDQLYRAAPLQAIEYEAKLAKDDKPVVVTPGASLVTPKGRSLYTAPKEQSLPAAIQEYQFAQQQGYRGSFEQWDRERRKAGASNVSVGVNTEKSFLGNFAEGIGKSMSTARDGAQASLQTINTVNRLFDALDSGQVMAGPGATFRQYGLQLGNVLGVAGKDAQEKLLNTRQAIQSLAQLELDAAQQMKGQGQITEAERAIIRRAASGDIDGMTPIELRLLGGVLDRTARTKIRGYNSQVAPLKQNPNAAPLTPFLEVQEPEQRGQQRVRRYNPKTGRIE